MKLKRIPPNYLAQYWSKVEKFIADALEHDRGEFSLEQVKVYLSKGDWVILGVFEESDDPIGVFVFQFANYPNDRIAILIATGGKGIFDKELNVSFEAFVKSMGATKIRGYVRDSMVRLSNRFGYEKVYNIVEKQI